MADSIATTAPTTSSVAPPTSQDIPASCVWVQSYSVPAPAAAPYLLFTLPQSFVLDNGRDLTLTFAPQFRPSGATVFTHSGTADLTPTTHADGLRAVITIPAAHAQAEAGAGAGAMWAGPRTDTVLVDFRHASQQPCSIAQLIVDGALELGGTFTRAMTKAVRWEVWGTRTAATTAPNVSKDRAMVKSITSGFANMQRLRGRLLDTTVESKTSRGLMKRQKASTMVLPRLANAVPLGAWEVQKAQDAHYTRSVTMLPLQLGDAACNLRLQILGAPSDVLLADTHLERASLVTAGGTQELVLLQREKGGSLAFACPLFTRTRPLFTWATTHGMPPKHMFLQLRWRSTATPWLPAQPMMLQCTYDAMTFASAVQQWAQKLTFALHCVSTSTVLVQRGPQQIVVADAGVA